MATEQGNQDKESWKSTDPKRAERLFDELSSGPELTPEVATSDPQKGLEEIVAKFENEKQLIYQQAHQHRSWLVKFYIFYTIVLSLVVISLVSLQAYVRTMSGSEQVELVPRDALNLLVIGMFGQFIGLLTIVTRKVWTYEPFLSYNRDNTKK